jgi:hypothetical protein
MAHLCLCVCAKGVPRARQAASSGAFKPAAGTVSARSSHMLLLLLLLLGIFNKLLHDAHILPSCCMHHMQSYNWVCQQ